MKVIFTTSPSGARAYSVVERSTDRFVKYILERDRERERARDPAQHTLLLGKSLGTQRRKIHSAVTIVPRLFRFRFLVPPYPRRILTKVLYQTDQVSPLYLS